jgi:hypothetical protein
MEQEGKPHHMQQTFYGLLRRPRTQLSTQPTPDHPQQEQPQQQPQSQQVPREQQQSELEEDPQLKQQEQRLLRPQDQQSPAPPSHQDQQSPAPPSSVKKQHRKQMHFVQFWPVTECESLHDVERLIEGVVKRIRERMDAMPVGLTGISDKFVHKELVFRIRRCRGAARERELRLRLDLMKLHLQQDLEQTGPQQEQTQPHEPHDGQQPQPQESQPEELTQRPEEEQEQQPQEPRKSQPEEQQPQPQQETQPQERQDQQQEPHQEQRLQQEQQAQDHQEEPQPDQQQEQRRRTSREPRWLQQFLEQEERRWQAPPPTEQHQQEKERQQGQGWWNQQQQPQSQEQPWREEHWRSRWADSASSSWSSGSSEIVAGSADRGIKRPRTSGGRPRCGGSCGQHASSGCQKIPQLCSKCCAAGGFCSYHWDEDSQLRQFVRQR